jgi:hypothetical protein
MNKLSGERGCKQKSFYNQKVRNSYLFALSMCLLRGGIGDSLRRSKLVMSHARLQTLLN